MLLYQILAFNIKSSNKTNKSRIFAPTWNNEFELPDGSYSVSDIQILFSVYYKKNMAHL